MLDACVVCPALHLVALGQLGILGAKKMNSKIFGFLLTSLMAVAPLTGRAGILGDFQGTYQNTADTNHGTIDLDFLTIVPVAGGFDLTGTVGLTGLTCGSANCGFMPDFTGTFDPATDAVTVTLEPTPASGNPVIDVFGALSPDMDTITGNYSSVGAVNPSTGTFSVTRVTSVPEPGALMLLTVGLAGVILIQVTRRKSA